MTQRTGNQVWRLSIHKAAQHEMDDLRNNHPQTLEAFLCVLDQLAEECNLRSADIPGFSVIQLHGKLNPWYRGKFQGKYVQWRFIFRLLQRVNGVVQEIEYDWQFDEAAQVHALQIVMVTNRDGNTYERVNGRYNTIHYQ